MNHTATAVETLQQLADGLLSDNVKYETVPYPDPGKRGEMTFGYLPAVIPEDLVPDAYGSIALYSNVRISELMAQMDRGFAGMRRSLIDESEGLRQLINYMLVTKQRTDGQILYAVYARGKGAEGRLEGAYSIGFGGHVELSDVETVEVNGTEIASSYWSTHVSGQRELIEEVAVLEQDVEITEAARLSVPMGFISDYRPDVPNWVGNTHIATFSTLPVREIEEVIDFEVKDDRYSKVGWFTKEELLAQRDRFESWSVLLIEEIEAVEDAIRQQY